jgi:AIR synthase-related protein
MSDPDALSTLALEILGARGLAHKADLAPVLSALALDSASPVPVGDDCAAIPDGDGWLLLAMEGFIDSFVAADPWFAGWCGAMVNLSDVAAMGGRPIALVDAVWSDGADWATSLLSGLRAGADAFGVPIVGGHANLKSQRGGFAAAILGRAKRLITSFDARPGDVLISVVDLRGGFRGDAPWWDAATGAPPARLRDDLDLLPTLAEAGLCAAGKDVSMAGLVGTALMLLEASGVGGVIDPHQAPRPQGVSITRWIAAFPSYGYVLAVSPKHVEAVVAHFSGRGIAASPFGHVRAGRRVDLAKGAETTPLWDFNAQPLVGCGPAPARAFPDQMDSSVLDNNSLNQKVRA